MRRLSLTLLATLAASVACTSHTAPISTPTASQAGEPSLSWGPAPAVFPAGAQLAVLQGDPSKTEPFTVRLRMPSGYRIPPHTHPTDENVTVVAGTFRVGMGRTFDGSAMQALPTGGFVTAPANMAHYAEAVGPTIVQVHAQGPFTLTYVNPADLPKPVRR